MKYLIAISLIFISIANDQEAISTISRMIRIIAVNP